MRRSLSFRRQRVIRPLNKAILIVLAGLSADVLAQQAQPRLEEIVVTAQKREQSLQDVPIAVTALTQEALAANRVSDVVDLSGLAPNVTIRSASGSSKLASFSMRGITSYGVVPGSDKQVSIYLDGVYLGTPRGSIFNMPDIAQLEILRGPQGTLFGRNSTAGAVSVATRDPTGEFGLTQSITIGNRDLFSSRTSLDLPVWNNLSVSATYQIEEQDGDVRNLGGGTVWDRTAFGKGMKTSPARLNEKDSETFFLAAKFEPNDDFSLTYKLDYYKDKGSPQSFTAAALYPDALGAFGPILEAIVAANPQTPLHPDGKRPSAVNNAFHVPYDHKAIGHNLTAVWHVGDVTLKNIMGYRTTEMLGATDISGLGGMLLPESVAPVFGVPAGTPFCVVCSQPETDYEQFSNELQVNYATDFLTLTAGALYFESTDTTGSSNNTFESGSFITLPDYVIPLARETQTHLDAKSTAVYTQAEFHLTPDLDLVAGWRLTRDEKSGRFQYGTIGDKTSAPFDYSKTKPSYSLGVNYKLADAVMVYAKYSEAFVSGGSIAGFAFEPEEVTSWEVGMKGDFLDSRLRTNLSIFDATYENYQTSQAASNFGRPDLGTIVVDLGGDLKANGFEFEATALPGYGLTLNASLGYTDIDVNDVRDIILDSVGGALFPGSEWHQTLSPEWTGSLSGGWESAPLFGNSYASLYVNGIWNSKIRLDANPARAAAVPEYGRTEFSPSAWVVNARAALHDIDLGPAVGEIALWGRNLTNNDHPTFALVAGSFVSTMYHMEARSYGIDLTVRF